MMLTHELGFGRWEQGTTVTALREKLQKEDGKRVVCWSNGNVFRSVTLLAVTWCEEERRRKGISNDADFDIAEALTKENLASFMSMLEFGKVRGYLHRTRSEYFLSDSQCIMSYHTTVQR